MEVKLIKGFAIGGYRSFSGEPQFLDNLSRINVLIGQNNCGKSNVLRALTLLYDKRRHYVVDGVSDIPKNSDQNQPTFAVKLAQEDLESLPSGRSSKEAFRILLRETLDSEGSFWAFFEYVGSAAVCNNDAKELSRAHNAFDQMTCARLGSIWSNISGAAVEEYQSIALQKLSEQALEKCYAVDFIPAIRSVTGTFNSNVDPMSVHSGADVVGQLHKMQHPPFGEEHLRDQFEVVNRFLKRVTQNETAEIEVPYDSGELLVLMDDKRLPLSSLGSGIEEIVILAAKTVNLSRQIVCIEEPELHLHPSLQRHLLRFLYDHTDNQYFITTHSAHFLDTVPCSVFHVELVEGRSEITPASSESAQFRICKDLGYRASDLLQANCILWVEGPSDRVYLKHWIEVAAPELREGLHYSIMFYGGRLLSHLSADDQEVDDFISLPKLNRHMGIVIDSDKAKPKARINATKHRIKTEFGQTDSFVWITLGREIENYIPKNKIRRAAEKVHPKKNWVDADQVYGQLTRLRKGNRGEESGLDKIKVARSVCDEPPDFEQLDLKKRVDELVEFIRSSNVGA